MEPLSPLTKAYQRWPVRPESDPDVLRAIASYLDGLDDAVGNIEDRQMQDDLRRIADDMEHEDG